MHGVQLPTTGYSSELYMVYTRTFLDFFSEIIVYELINIVEYIPNFVQNYEVAEISLLSIRHLSCSNFLHLQIQISKEIHSVTGCEKSDTNLKF